MIWRDTPEDREIAASLKRAKSEGHEEAAKRYWGCICDNYREKVHQLSEKWLSKMRISGHFDPDEAVNEVFVNLYDRIDSYDESRPFSPWMRKVAMNRLIDTARNFYTTKGYNKETKTTEKPLPEQMQEFSGNPLQEKENISNQLIAQVKITKLHAHFKTIGKESCFDILVLHYLHGTSDRRIAIFMGEIHTSEKNKKSIHNATERIRYRRKNCKNEAEKFRYG
jgi:RNA polymerase sigma-70 factor (ECF subfamily)